MYNNTEKKVRKTPLGFSKVSAYMPFLVVYVISGKIGNFKKEIKTLKKNYLFNFCILFTSNNYSSSSAFLSESFFKRQIYVFR